MTSSGQHLACGVRSTGGVGSSSSSSSSSSVSSSGSSISISVSNQKQPCCGRGGGGVDSNVDQDFAEVELDHVIFDDSMAAIVPELSKKRFVRYCEDNFCLESVQFIQDMRFHFGLNPKSKKYRPNIAHPTQFNTATAISHSLQPPANASPRTPSPRTTASTPLLSPPPQAATPAPGLQTVELDHLITTINFLSRLYIESNASRALNISSRVRSQFLDLPPPCAVEMLSVPIISDPEMSLRIREWCYARINSLWEGEVEIRQLMKRDVWIRYLTDCRLRMRLRLSTQIALFWKVPFSFSTFFTFPNPINCLEARLHAVCGSLTIILALGLAFFLNWPYLFFWIVYGFFFRVTSGPRLDPQAWFVLFCFRPLVEDKLGWASSRFEAAPARRLAQLIGLCFSSVATILWFTGQMIPCYAVWLALLAATGLMAVFDICLACIFYHQCYNYFYPPQLNNTTLPCSTDSCGAVTIPTATLSVTDVQLKIEGEAA